MPHLVIAGDSMDYESLVGIAEKMAGPAWRGASQTAIFECAGPPPFFLGLFPKGKDWIIKVAHPREARSRPEVRSILFKLKKALEQTGAKIVYANLPEKIVDRRSAVEVGWRDVLVRGWDGAFGARGRLVVEIGFGSGEFLSEISAKSPKSRFVGIEISRPSIERAARTMKGRANVRLLNWDARAALATLFKEDSISKVHLNFPFPWDKRKQQKRRLVNRDFAQVLARKLKRGGSIEVVSDSKGFVQSASRGLKKDGHFRVEDIGVAGGVVTRYRRKWEKEGRRIYGVRATKSRSVKAALPPTAGFCEEPIRLACLVGELAESYSPATLTGVGGGPIRLKQIYRRDDELLLEVLAIEPAMQQDFMMSIVAEEAGAVAQPHPAYPPLDTPALRGMLEAMRQHLEAGVVKKKLPGIFERLEAAFGPQHWWPMDRAYHERGRSDPRDEVIIGAILTQNTAWTHVEKALANLKAEGALTLDAIGEMKESRLSELIRPAGYFRAKAKKLKAFAKFLNSRHGGDLNALAKLETEPLRKELLSVWGIGPETADSIALYAFNRSTFVIDAYTARILGRVGISDDDLNYHDWQNLIAGSIQESPEMHGEFHALFVTLAKQNCTSRDPKCATCPIVELCLYGRARVSRPTPPAGA